MQAVAGISLQLISLRDLIFLHHLPVGQAKVLDFTFNQLLLVSYQ